MSSVEPSPHISDSGNVLLRPSLELITGEARLRAVKVMANAILKLLSEAESHKMAFEDLINAVAEETGYDSYDVWNAIDYGRHQGFLIDNVVSNHVELRSPE